MKPDFHGICRDKEAVAFKEIEAVPILHKNHAASIQAQKHLERIFIRLKFDQFS